MVTTEITKKIELADSIEVTLKCDGDGKAQTIGVTSNGIHLRDLDALLVRRLAALVAGHTFVCAFVCADHGEHEAYRCPLCDAGTP